MATGGSVPSLPRTTPAANVSDADKREQVSSGAVAASDSPEDIQITTGIDKEPALSTPSSSDKETVDDAIGDDDEYHPTINTAASPAETEHRITRSAARNERSQGFPPVADTRGNSRISPNTSTPTQPRRPKRSLTAFQIGRQSPSPIRKAHRRNPSSSTLLEPSGEQLSGPSTGTASAKMKRTVTPRTRTLQSTTPRPRSPTSRRKPISRAATASHASRSSNPETSQRKQTDTARLTFDKIRASLACPQDNCVAIGAWRVKGANDIQCTQCTLRVTKQRFVALVEQYTEVAEQPIPHPQETEIENATLRTIPNQEITALHSKVAEQNTQLRQLMDLQTQQQRHIDRLEKLLADQEAILTRFVTKEVSGEGLPANVPPPEGLGHQTSTESQTGTQQPDSSTKKGVSGAAKPRPNKQQRDKTGSKNGTENSKTSSPTVQTQEPNHNNCTASTPQQEKGHPQTHTPTYRDAVVNRENSSTTRPTEMHRKHTIPWAKMGKNTGFAQLSKPQQEAIKRAQKALAPLSRPEAQRESNISLQTIYFGNVRRAPYRTLYRALHKLIDRKHLFGISLIGSDVIEILTDKTAVPVILHKMRFMKWKHLSDFSPETQDDAKGITTGMSHDKRIKAVYIRWYMAWQHAKNEAARAWYATQAERLNETYADILSVEPTKATFQTFHDTRKRELDEAREAIRTAAMVTEDSDSFLVPRTSAATNERTKGATTSGSA